MRSALDDFLGHVKAIERTLDLRDGLVMFGQEPVRQGAPAIAKVHRSVRKIGLSGLQPSLDGGVLLLVAALEQFVTDLIVDFSSLLPGIVPAYDDLPSAIRSANERLTGEALVDRRSRFSDYERERFVQNLRDCQQGVVPYVLNGEALALVNRNLNATVLEEVIGRLGIGDIWTVVSKTRTLQRWSGRGEQRSRDLGLVINLLT